MRWILLDEVISIQKGKSAQTRSHYPEAEFGSEILMIEMMAQTGGLIVGAETNYRQDLIFAKIETAEFFGRGKIGEALWIEAQGDQLKSEGGWLEGRVKTDRDVIASSRFLLMNVDLLVPESKNPVTFNQTFMNHFRILEKLQ